MMCTLCDDTCWVSLHRIGCLYVHNVRTAKCMVVKVKLTFIGHSGSNCYAFYLYRATDAGLSNTPFFAHLQELKGVAIVR